MEWFWDLPDVLRWLFEAAVVLTALWVVFIAAMWILSVLAALFIIVLDGFESRARARRRRRFREAERKAFVERQARYGRK